MSISAIVLIIGLVSAIFGLLAAVIGILVGAIGLVAVTLKAIYWGVKLKKELQQN